jgi:hypothetical protein
MPSRATESRTPRRVGRRAGLAEPAPSRVTVAPAPPGPAGFDGPQAATGSLELFRLELFRLEHFRLDFFRRELFRLDFFRREHFRLELFRLELFGLELELSRLEPVRLELATCTVVRPGVPDLGVPSTLFCCRANSRCFWALVPAGTATEVSILPVGLGVAVPRIGPFRLSKRIVTTEQPLGWQALDAGVP